MTERSWSELRSLPSELLAQVAQQPSVDKSADDVGSGISGVRFSLAWQNLPPFRLCVGQNTHIHLSVFIQPPVQRIRDFCVYYRFELWPAVVLETFSVWSSSKIKKLLSRCKRTRKRKHFLEAAVSEMRSTTQEGPSFQNKSDRTSTLIMDVDLKKNISWSLSISLVTEHLDSWRRFSRYLSELLVIWFSSCSYFALMTSCGHTDTNPFINCFVLEFELFETKQTETLQTAHVCRDTRPLAAAVDPGVCRHSCSLSEACFTIFTTTLLYVR